MFTQHFKLTCLKRPINRNYKRERSSRQRKISVGEKGPSLADRRLITENRYVQRTYVRRSGIEQQYQRRRARGATACAPKVISWRPVVIYERFSRARLSAVHNFVACNKVAGCCFCGKQPFASVAAATFSLSLSFSASHVADCLLYRSDSDRFSIECEMGRVFSQLALVNSTSFCLPCISIFSSIFRDRKNRTFPFHGIYSHLRNSRAFETRRCANCANRVRPKADAVSGICVKEVNWEVWQFRKFYSYEIMWYWNYIQLYNVKKL